MGPMLMGGAAALMLAGIVHFQRSPTDVGFRTFLGGAAVVAFVLGAFLTA